ncbi:hypothetical protein HY251_15705 [bacterium]|nr:hypothetical protein [bacterium]
MENVRALLVEETVARPEDVCVQVTLSLAERHLARLRCLAAGEDVTLDQAATAAVLKMLVRTERTHTRSVRRSRRP